MTHQKIALFIFDMILIAVCVTGLLVTMGAVDNYEREQEAKQIARVAAIKSNEQAIRRAELILALDKGEQMTNFKAEMK